MNEAYRPLSISMYHLHMHRWLEVFSREQLLVVNGDRLIDDPLSQLRRIETFLGTYLRHSARIVLTGFRKIFFFSGFL